MPAGGRRGIAGTVGDTVQRWLWTRGRRCLPLRERRERAWRWLRTYRERRR